MVGMKPLTTLFFATDVHGSDVCWKKFIGAAQFYKADVLILGGDMTGKAIVPIFALGKGRYKATLLEQESILEGEDALAAMEKTITNRGYYPYRVGETDTAYLRDHPERVDQIFVEQAVARVQRWLEYADQKLAGTNIRVYVCPGNDDMPEIDADIDRSKVVRRTEGQVIALDEHHEMISTGWSNFTPWNTFREEEEPALKARIEQMVGALKNVPNAIFNLHCPAYGSSLDEAPELTADLRPKQAGRYLIPVGSHAVRAVIEGHQPLLALFGHIHEGKGATRLGRTLCINPGSMYEQGVLLGALIALDRNSIKSYVLTTG
jgi:Icc-related predicted phosphoesterase